MITIRYNDSLITIKPEDHGVVFTRLNRSGGQVAYPVCVLREPGETDAHIVERYKSTLDERLIR